MVYSTGELDDEASADLWFWDGFKQWESLTEEGMAGICDSNFFFRRYSYLIYGGCLIVGVFRSGGDHKGSSVQPG